MDTPVRRLGLRVGMLAVSLGKIDPADVYEIYSSRVQCLIMHVLVLLQGSAADRNLHPRAGLVVSPPEGPEG